MEVKLESDYFDAYDVWFDSKASVTFGRNAKGSTEVSRTQMFQAFEKLGIETPLWGIASVVSRQCKELVLYTDEHAHCGEGKMLYRVEDIPTTFRDCLTSQFMGEKYGVTHRLFCIAGKIEWFTHVSHTDWRSNHGDGDLLHFNREYSNLDRIEDRVVSGIKNPVFAIDFVEQKNTLYAIDWNPAPRVSGTPAHAQFQEFFGGNRGIAEAIKANLLDFPATEYFNNNVIHWRSGALRNPC